MNEMYAEALDDSAAIGSPIEVPVKIRHVTDGSEPGVLTDIYNEETNMVTWKRVLSTSLQDTVKCFLETKSAFQASMILTPDNSLNSIRDALGSSDFDELSEDLVVLVDMFCCLFEMKSAGLRLAVLNQAMCPRFHVDRVPCRLVTTYHGAATEWLPHQSVNRSRLGAGSDGLADDQSGLYVSQDDIQKLSSGDVALLKGERWEGNENAGLVHRSPEQCLGEPRLVLTLDLVN